MLATVATAQSTTSAVPGLRLPRNVFPVAYAPTLTIDPGKSARTATVVPCFDEPDMKAPWRLTLRVPAGGDGATLFDSVVEVAVSSQDANEREDVLKALGSFRDPPLLDRALALALDARLNPRDSTAPR